MGSLSNLYISQSYISLLHLGSDNTASATLTQIEDGLGNGIGIYVNNGGALKATEISASIISASQYIGFSELNPFTQSVNDKFDALQNTTASLIEKTGSYATTGSNTFIGNQTITGDVQINGTLSATEIHTLIESSSIIFSSGSNILGDNISDTQTLNGTMIVSGSGQITGSLGITGTITSPTITSINTEITNLQLFSSSINSYTSSNNNKWNNLATQTGSFITETESGSFLITASVSASTLTFTKGDASTFNLTVGRGDGFPYTGSAVISGSLSVTGSIGIQSSSFSGSPVSNITDIYPSASKVNYIVSLTQAEYNAISSPDAGTLYIII